MLDHPPRRHITLSAVVSVVAVFATVIPAGRYVLTPWFVTVASEALGDEISKKVRTETAPASAGVKSMLEDKIDELKIREAVLVARQARSPQSFTDADATELAGVRSRLQKQEAALRNFKAQVEAAQ